MVDQAMSNRPHKIDGREVETKRAVPRDVCNLHPILFLIYCYMQLKKINIAFLKLILMKYDGTTILNFSSF